MAKSTHSETPKSEQEGFLDKILNGEISEKDVRIATLLISNNTPNRQIDVFACHALLAMQILNDIKYLYPKI